MGRQNAHALRLQAVGDSAFQAVLFCSQILDGEEWKYSRSLTEGAIANTNDRPPILKEPKNVTLESPIRIWEAKTMSPLLQQVLRQVEQLETAERLELIQQIAEGLKMPTASQSKLKWSDLRGMGHYPMMSEDAQDWVSRTRRAGDEHRDRILRR